LVIFGHSYAVVGPGVDPMAKWNGVLFSGGFALHVFFFLSGLLVTHSFLVNPDLGHWFTSRVLRIFPGLCVCLLLTTLILGPLSSNISMRRYLSAHETWDYFLGNLLVLRTRYFLPGVFANNLEKAVNGPLWSLYLEVRLYLVAGILLWLCRRLRREWLTLVFAVIAVVGLTAPRWIFIFGESENHSTCSALFLLGALCALWSEKVIISGLWLAVLLLAANKYVYTAAFAPLFFFATSYFVLCFGYSRWLTGIRLPGDYSYGLYIYGWPVQQLVAEHFPYWSSLKNAAAAMTGAAILAALSWHFVEKPSLNQKRRISGAMARHGRSIFLALGCCGVIVAALYYYSSQPVERLGSIVALGPSELIAGERFNVQPDGLSAMWIRLPSSVSAESSVVFRGHKLKSVIAGPIVTASVPDELFRDPGEADIYVVDQSYFPWRRTAIAKIKIVSRSR
jgi:peptidoglycan/LPS O-acetylase OafA/YrhL